MIVGIDNGLSGGIVALNNDGTICTSWQMPIIKAGTNQYDCPSLNFIFKAIKKLAEENGENLFAYLEQAHPRAVSGKRANFMTGYGYGLIEGIIFTLNISYEIVSPQTWMKELKLKKSDKNDKPSIIWCIRKYPNEMWKKSERSKKYHDGLTDAAAISWYGFLQQNKK